MERLQQFIEEPFLILLVTYYLTSTEMERIHLKDNMEKFKVTYYEAIEILVNLSVCQKTIIENIIKDQSLIDPQNNNLNLQRLLAKNNRKYSNGL